MRYLIALLAVCAFAQEGAIVSQTEGPPRTAIQKINVWSGSDLVRECFARSQQPQLSNGSISAATTANPVVFTSTGHGFDLNSTPKVTIAGGTGNWVAVNGTWTATIVDANSFSIPVDSTSFGAVTGTLTFSTFAPRTTQSIWAVKQHYYNSGALILSCWAGGSTSMSNICSAASQCQ